MVSPTSQWVGDTRYPCSPTEATESLPQIALDMEERYGMFGRLLALEFADQRYLGRAC